MIGETLAHGHAPLMDIIQPFQLDLPDLRGRLVRLGPVLDRIIGRHGYPAPVAQLLAEAVAASVLLASLLKYEGVFTLQAKGDGPVKTMVTDVTSSGDVRGYVHFEGDLPEPGARNASLKDLVGAGYLAFTVDQGADTERYQGIVALEGDTLSQALEHYFRQSEQLDTSLLVATSVANGRWHAGALVLQRLPEDERAPMAEATAEENWIRGLTLLSTCRPEELLGSGIEKELGPHGLLYRLFHEEEVRVFTPHTVREACRCSEERVRTVLSSLPPEELETLKVDGAISVTCEFCNRTYSL